MSKTWTAYDVAAVTDTRNVRISPQILLVSLPVAAVVSLQLLSGFLRILFGNILTTACGRNGKNRIEWQLWVKYETRLSRCTLDGLHLCNCEMYNFIFRD